MKKIIIAACIFVVTASTGFASSGDEKEDGTKLNLWIPGFLVKIAGNIVENNEGKAEGQLIKKFGGMNICIREGVQYSAKTDKKVSRKIEKLDKKNYEPLVKVYADNTIVDLRIKENKKGVIKRMSCIIDEKDETFVYVKMHCRLDPSEIASLVKQMQDGDIKMID